MWELNKETHAALLALDICGFSTDPDLGRLLAHREALFQAVREAPYVPDLIQNGSVKVQFVGDELRFAFRGDIERCALKVREFVESAFENLARSKSETRLKGVVLGCDLKWRVFRGCHFFDGRAAFSCSDWLGCALENQVVINAEFKKALDELAIPVSSLEKVPCNNETGYLLVPGEGS